MKQDLNAALARLAEAFPQTFTLEKHQPHQPLKVGIAAEIRERCPDLDRRALAATLSFYTKRIVYLQALIVGAARVDLDGNPAGEVTAGDAEYAAAKLAEILASRETKRAAAVDKDAAQVAKPAAVRAAAAAPPAVKVVTLKKRPVLRLPAFRTLGPDADHTATATTSASAAMTATIAMKAAASESDMSHIIAE